MDQTVTLPKGKIIRLQDLFSTDCQLQASLYNAMKKLQRGTPPGFRLNGKNLMLNRRCPKTVDENFNGEVLKLVEEWNQMTKDEQSKWDEEARILLKGPSAYETILQESGVDRSIPEVQKLLEVMSKHLGSNQLTEKPNKELGELVPKAFSTGGDPRGYFSSPSKSGSHLPVSPARVAGIFYVFDQHEIGLPRSYQEVKTLYNEKKSYFEQVLTEEQRALYVEAKNLDAVRVRVETAKLSIAAYINYLSCLEPPQWILKTVRISKASKLDFSYSSISIPTKRPSGRDEQEDI